MFDRNRRAFITLLGGVAAWPGAARGQQPKLPTIGFLGTTSPSVWQTWTTAFVQRLRELGWIEGRTVAIEYRWAEGRQDRWAEFATDFARLKVDIVLTAADQAVNAAKQAMPTTPIVFAISNDPVGTGMVASLARPGGNVTGLANLVPDTVGKRVELLREIVPTLRQLAIIANVGFPDAVLEMGMVEPSAKAFGFDVVPFEIRRREDIAPAFEKFNGRAQALYVCPDPLMLINRLRIITLALGQRLPTMYGYRDYVEAGGLISYGPNIAANFRRAAEFVDKILRGTKPGDIPVEQPVRFDLIVNLITAKALGLTVPPMLLARADEVIE
jgi:putative tryptophan/tyrosine transport system substrate-binding protein